MLSRLDRRHKAIALAVQRAHESRRPLPIPQRLAQRCDTGFQNRVPDKLVRPQMFEEFVLGHHPIAMCQEVGEHLKGFAPQLDGRPRTMQLSALGVQDIVAKEVAHCPTPPLRAHPAPGHARWPLPTGPRAIPCGG